jgi:hypothetical protein
VISWDELSSRERSGKAEDGVGFPVGGEIYPLTAASVGLPEGSPRSLIAVVMAISTMRPVQGILRVVRASLLLGVVVVPMWTLSASSREVDVWLLGGQSNMQGIAKLAELPPDLPETIPHTFFWNGNSFEPLLLGQTQTSTRAGEFGPEVGFALDMATPEQPVYLVKYHASGMPLHHGWDGSQWVGDPPLAGRRNFYPGEEPDDPCQGTLYREMVAQFRAALRSFQAEGREPRVRGFLWMQG